MVEMQNSCNNSLVTAMSVVDNGKPATNRQFYMSFSVENALFYDINIQIFEFIQKSWLQTGSGCHSDEAFSSGWWPRAERLLLLCWKEIK